MYQSLGPDHKVWKSKPELDDETIFYYVAWQALSGSRSVGLGGAMSILLTEIEAYCRLALVPITERLSFARIIRRADMEFLCLMDSRKSAVIAQPKE